MNCRVSYVLQDFLEGGMKLSALLTVLMLAFPIAHLALGQAVTLSLKSKEVHHASEVHVELFLNAPSKSGVAGLQWEFKVPQGVEIVKVEAGEAIKKSGKTLVCQGAKCLIYGWKSNSIPQGEVAVARFRFQPGAPAANSANTQKDYDEIKTKKPEVQIDHLVCTSFTGKSIPATVGSQPN